MRQSRLMMSLGALQVFMNILGPHLSQVREHLSSDKVTVIIRLRLLER